MSIPRIVLPAEPLLAGETALRPWRDTDVLAITEACQDPEIARWTPIPAPYRETDARAFLLQRYDAMYAGVTAPFAVVHAVQGHLLGSVALNRIQPAHRRAEIGYWLSGAARGRGHATAAVRLISRWGFDTLGLGRIGIVAAVENLASQRVAERAGFTREAVLRSYMRGKLGREDMVSFSLLPGEPAA